MNMIFVHVELKYNLKGKGVNIKKYGIQMLYFHIIEEKRNLLKMYL